MTESGLTIVFDPPYYKGIFEIVASQRYATAIVVFGPSEPTLPQISQLIRDKWSQLVFRWQDDTMHSIPAIKNPKRRQRAARRADTNNQLTKAQQMVHQNQCEQKRCRRQNRRALRRVHEQKKFIERQVKKHAKHRGH